MPQSTLNRHLSEGKLSADSVVRIAGALGMDAGWLLTGGEPDAQTGSAPTERRERTVLLEDLEPSEAAMVYKLADLIQGVARSAMERGAPAARQNLPRTLEEDLEALEQTGRLDATADEGEGERRAGNGSG